jgi:hypothetical protein
VKIDVEGAEELVFEGAEELLSFRELRAIVFEAQEGASGQPANQRLTALLNLHGFRVAIFGRSDSQTADGMNNYLATRGRDD